MEPATYSRYYLLYLPWIASLLFVGDPVVAYLVAWAGSFFIFYISFTNKVKPTSPGLPLTEKILRPLFLTQVIFCGYMSCSSIFYFLDQMGYQYFTLVSDRTPVLEEIATVAACQRAYLLGHIAFVHGILVFYRSDIEPKYKVQVGNWPAFFLLMVVICNPLGSVLSRIGGLAVLGNSVDGLGMVAATIALALAIPLRQGSLTLAAGILFGMTLLKALTSGFKEPVIVSLLMLGLFLYPFYKRVITLTFIPLMLFLFTVLPTYVNTFRSQNWSGDKDAEAAKAEALKKVQEDMAGEGLKETNWAFLTNRISEIGMFVRYRESMEYRGTTYGFQILEQTAIALVPRVFWSDKPSIENMAMQRVWDNGIVSEESSTSAKPQYIVDGYLSGGLAGIWLALFFYGAIAQLICNKAETFFGGYFFGTVFVFTGMFRTLWRGNCFEYIGNNILYGIVGLVFLFYIFRELGVLVKIQPAE
ncbi:hypothetical protein V9K67_05540 [Paraflavisolibacter sp. H34]|uniref:exosortase Y-associated Wzy-like protein n=1 Tax=Huijunlia imazamoxiresistens TaxID=3127457 RepID=UPI003017A181